jgi:hypothetical protein
VPVESGVNASGVEVGDDVFDAMRVRNVGRNRTKRYAVEFLGNSQGAKVVVPVKERAH